MKILVLEYITGGGMRQQTIPPSLYREGGLMLNALAADLLANVDVELLVFHDDRLPQPLSGPRIQSIPIHDAADFQTQWQAAIKTCDTVWPIAPETDGILEQLCRDVEAIGKPLLNCPAAAVRIGASKLATIRCLAQAGLPVVPTFPLGPDRRGLQDHVGLFVIKPDDGAGCENSRVITIADVISPSGTAIKLSSVNRKSLRRSPDEACGVRDDRSHVPPHSASSMRATSIGTLIIQPLIEGEALSLSALFAHGETRLLSVNRQIIEQTRAGFSLKACHVNALADDEGHWQQLTQHIATAIPELWGYVGIDLILTATGPLILEINPRLTTSYAGLHQATGENPAQHVITLWQTGKLPQPRRCIANPVVISLE